jgi:hypothetical protein
MKRAILEQHRLLDALFLGARGALASAEIGSVRDALAELGEALEAHFELENSLYYPPIRVLRPEHAASVRGFEAAHERFLRELGVIGQQAAEGALGAARAAFDAFALAFASHEAAEEDLLRAIEAEVSAAR